MAFLIGCIFVISTITLIEIVLRMWNKNNQLIIQANPTILIPDPFLGRKVRANVKGSCTIQKGESEVIYTYSTDIKGRRITPQSSETKKTKICLFFPCSFTFGIGVNDDETFPFYFAQQNPECKVYNYGIPSGSPQQMYLLISEPNFTDDLECLPLIIIYWFIPHHLERLIGTPNLVGSWGGRLPCIEMENDSLIYKGLFMNAYPTYYLINRFLNSFMILQKLYSIKYTKDNYSEKDIILFIRILEASKEKLSPYFPKTQFIFLFNPGSSKEIPKLKERLLHNKNFFVIDFSNDEKKIKMINTLMKSNEYLGIDNHPTSKTHRLMAEWVTEYLNESQILQ